MSIVAGLIIKSSPAPSWSSPNWNGVTIEIKYPSGQNENTNPVSINDILVDMSGRIWKVMTVTKSGTNTFSVNITCISETPGPLVQPDASTNRGVVSTPASNGALLVPFSKDLTEDTVTRTISNYNMNHIQAGTGTGVSSGNDLIGLSITGSTGQVLGVTSSGQIGLIPGGGISDSGDLVGLTAPSGATDGQVLGVSGGQLSFITPPSGGSLDSGDDLTGLPAPTGASTGQVLGIDSTGHLTFIDQSGTGGSSSFTGLTDTPSTLSGMAGKVLAVNSTGTAIEFIDGAGLTYIEYPVNVTSNTGGTIQPSGIFNVSEGSNITFTITPDTGYEVQSFTVNGVQQTISGNTFITSNISQTTYVDVTFGETGEVTINPGTFPPFDFAAVDTTKSVFAIGYDSMAVIGSDGNIYTRGKNDRHQLGDGTTIDRYTWGRITISGNYVYINSYEIDETAFTSATGMWNAITSTSNLFRWGDEISEPTEYPIDLYKLTLDGPESHKLTTSNILTNFREDIDISSVGCLNTSYCISFLDKPNLINDHKRVLLSSTGKLYTITGYTFNDLGLEEYVDFSSITFSKVVGTYSLVLLSSTNDLYFWGYDGGKKLYWDEFSVAQTIPTPTIMSHGKFKDVGISTNLVIAIENTTSYVHTWGTNVRTNTIEYKEYPELGTCKAVFAENDTVVAITNADEVYIWGNLSMLDPNLTTWIDVPFKLN
jgi:hypothetical protein